MCVVSTEQALGAADEDDLTDAIDAMKQNDVVGAPVAMRLGVRAGPAQGADADGDARADVARAQSLVALAAGELGVFHFDTCALGQSALPPAALIEALEEAGVESRLELL